MHGRCRGWIDSAIFSPSSLVVLVPWWLKSTSFSACKWNAVWWSDCILFSTETTFTPSVSWYSSWHDSLFICRQALTSTTVKSVRSAAVCLLQGIWSYCLLYLHGLCFSRAVLTCKMVNLRALTTDQTRYLSSTILGWSNRPSVTSDSYSTSEKWQLSYHMEV